MRPNQDSLKGLKIKPNHNTTNKISAPHWHIMGTFHSCRRWVQLFKRKKDHTNERYTLKFTHTFTLLYFLNLGYFTTLIFCNWLKARFIHSYTFLSSRESKLVWHKPLSFSNRSAIKIYKYFKILFKIVFHLYFLNTVYWRSCILIRGVNKWDLAKGQHNLLLSPLCQSPQL